MTAASGLSEATKLAPYVPRALLARLARPIDVLTETVPCTMVFADISGFTRLSERLARRGEEGAEQLVDAINSCFSALLAEAYGRGGSLVKFGGDAMLLLFYDQEGDQQHAARACCAAVEMRRILRRAGRIRAGDSELVLRMSVGLHSGAYAMFVVGGSHRDLLFAGPAASTVARLEAAAGSGQILISPETARRLPRSCVGSALGPGRLLARAPAACEWNAPVGLPTPPAEVLARFLPVAVRAHLERGALAPEHRAATVAFLQFGGIDEVVVRDGNDAVARRLDDLVRLIQGAAERYQVCFLDSDIAVDGVKIRLSAGAPRVVGDDEERMLLALRHIVEARPPFPVRIGVHRGPLFTAHVGPVYRRWYAVMGDTVNLAARLVGKAPPGRIYATREVLRGAKTAFEQHTVEPFAVKGKSRPVQVWDVGRPVRGASDSAIRMELPLVGRDRELSVLRGAIDAARRGSGALVELVGEAGSGKSRLMAEAGRFAQGMVRLRASCEVYTREDSYHAWRAPLRTLLGLTGEESPHVMAERLKAEVESAAPDLLPWLSLIAIVLDVEIAPSVEVERLAGAPRAAKLHDVVLRFLGRALVVPTLLEVEQAHLMDTASVALFQALARELESSAWVVVVTRRDTDGGLVVHRAHPRVELGPLSPADAYELAVSAPEAFRLPPHVLELAVERSGGSPQFLLDLLAAAAAGDRDRLPASVGAATMARIDALDPADAALVRRAAVLGLSFREERLVDVLEADMPVPDDRVWARLSTVFAREPGGLVRFRRPALQEVAYASLPFKLRRRLHEAVGLRLEREQAPPGEREADAAVLSNHFALAGDHARAQRYALVAARRATERSAPADAVRLYRRAIDAARASGVVEDPQALADAWEQMGEELRRVGEPVAARRALREARRLLCEDPIAQARLCDRQAEVAERSEGLGSAVRWVMRGLRSLGELDSTDAISSRARLHSHLTGIRNRQGRWAEAVRVGRQAIAEAEAVGELRALARACYGVDWALRESGRPEEANHSWRALEIYEQLDIPEEESRVLNNLGMFAYFDGRWDDAIGLYRRSRAASERAHTPSDAARSDCNIGEILSDQGRVEEAAEHLERARRVWSATAERHSVAFIDLLLARLATRRGEGARAVPRLEAAMHELRRFSMDAYASFAEALLAEAEAFGGDPERALQIAHDQLELTDRNRPLLARAAGTALARLGRVDEARAELGRALSCARERGSEYDVAATIDVLSALGAADAGLRRERDEILRRLRIVALPAVASAL
jgi:class 3 adenylate cyclase/tetratricopeptide (TPR) repeat protein